MTIGTRAPIIIDTREPQETAQVISGLLAAAAIPSRREYLDSADYLLLDRQGRSLGIERKTPLDFLNSISDGRLESQLERMLADYDLRLLVLHGHYEMGDDEKIKTGSTWSKRKTGWHYTAFQLKLLAVQGRYDVRVLVTRSDREFAALLRALYRQGEEGKFHV